jgi:hypothetical protein
MSPQGTAPELVNVHGACHCGAVRFSANIDLKGAFRCNCSICAKLGSTIGSCDPSAFKLESGQAELSEYEFGPKLLTRFFCKRCGVQCFARARDAEGKLQFIGVNLNTLEGTELADLSVVYFDGRHDVFEPRDTPAPLFPERRA